MLVRSLKTRLLQALGVAALALLLSACAYTPYRTEGKTCTIEQPAKDERGNLDWESSADGTRPCANRWQVAVNKPVQFSMNFVEIDEQGVLANRDQANAAVEEASKEEADGSYVIVFVHGWHHNASSGDGNVRGFYDALSLVSLWNPKRKIKGVYIGWRGDSVPITGLRYLTFWDRKNTSDEVGRGGLLEFLLRLERGVKSPEHNGRNKLLVVGHSFGASVTFNALAHLYLGRFLDGVYARAETQRFRGYGDLVVLINPAIEAMRYMPFQSAIDYYSRPTSKPKLDFSHETRPVLVVLSSQSDRATRIAFPAARFVSTALEAHSTISATHSPDEQGNYSEWNMDRDTVGNFAGFQTHHPLLLSDEATDTRVLPAERLRGRERCDSLEAPDMWQRLNTNVVDVSDERGGAVFPKSGVRVRRIPNLATEGSPYVVAAVSPKIIDGHTDIGRPNLLCWINQLLDTKEVEVRQLLSTADAD
jgi:pimeloyl-ACP methyl ester carboxylesterase